MIKNFIVKKYIAINEWCKENTLLSGIFSSIAASVILGVIGYIFAVKPVSEDLKGINNSLIEMNGTMATVQSQISDIQNDNYNEQISELQSTLENQIYDVQNVFNEYKSDIDNKIDNIINSENTVIVNNEIMVSPDLLSSLQNTYKTDDDVFLSSQKCQFSNTETILFLNLKNGKMYSLNDLNEEQIPIHYTDDNGDDVFFKGQYDKNGYWDGNCIINRYKNGNLILIMDAVYDSGKLISYKQVFSYEKTFLESNYTVWAISERQPEINEDNGFTWTYFRQQDYLQLFETNSFNSTDILNVDDFKKCVPLIREGYYSGYISNGYYNDNTGNAYLVKYSENGYTRYLYVGKLVDGYPNDNSGDAWCISWGYDDTHYYFYQGNFKNGKHVGTPRKISLEEIYSIISNYDFECDLIWNINV